MKSEEQLSNAVNPIDEECIGKARSGDCSFYECFERRHPCLWNNFAIKHGWTYCRRFNSEYAKLTPQGQQWLNSTRQCAMMTMVAYYRSETTNCPEMETQFQKIHSQCSVDNGICNGRIALENKRVFFRVYKLSTTVMTKFLRTLDHCSEDTIQPAINWLQESFNTAVEHSSKIMDNLPSVDDIRKKIPSPDEIINKLPSRETMLNMMPSKDEIMKRMPSRDDIMKHMPSTDEIRKRLPSSSEILSKLPSGDDMMNKLPSRKDITTKVKNLRNIFD